MRHRQDVRIQSRTIARRRSVKGNDGTAALADSPSGEKESFQIRRLFAHLFVHVREKPGTGANSVGCPGYAGLVEENCSVCGIADDFHIGAFDPALEFAFTDLRNRANGKYY